MKRMKSSLIYEKAWLGDWRNVFGARALASFGERSRGASGRLRILIMSPTSKYHHEVKR